MTIKIIPANEARSINNLVIVLYGMPGLGKTTAAFTANKPILLDFDNGVLRAAKKGDATPPILNWSEVAGLAADDLKDYDTIIVDTVGRALEILSDSLIKQNPKYGKADGSLSLQGYGALSTAFRAFTNKLRGFGKDIVLLAHAKEDKDGDTVTYRIDAVGSSKQEIYKICDLLGYFHSINNSNHLSFNPSDSYTGKNCANLPILQIPAITNNNHYLADLIELAKNNINKVSSAQIQEQAKFDEALAIIGACENVDEINNVLTNEYITKNKALASKLATKAKELGLVGNTETRQYELKVA